MRLTTLILAVLLTGTGCATLERHPVATAIGAGLIVGSIAASGHRAQGPDVATPSVACAKPEMCK